MFNLIRTIKTGTSLHFQTAEHQDAIQNMYIIYLSNMIWY